MLGTVTILVLPLSSSYEQLTLLKKVEQVHDDESNDESKKIRMITLILFIERSIIEKII